ncbi:MAG TPA: hypothetical protein VKP64_12985 [Mycobacteriales bacterium]|nr:hypothetical protein [Mycobacteriales bacterium]
MRAAEAIYARLRAEEARHQRVADALEASSRLLRDLLAERGQTYDEFVWSLAGGANARGPRRVA